jgi:hypothetical protein
MLPDPTGRRVIILSGRYEGNEGICLGPSHDGGKWMVSPDNTNEIVALNFDSEFGILISTSN